MSSCRRTALALCLAVAVTTPGTTHAFVSPPSSSHFSDQYCRAVVGCYCNRNDVVDKNGAEPLDRRSTLFGTVSFIGAALLAPTAAVAGETRQGIELTPFNSLTFQYRGSDFEGLDTSAINEPSIPYQEFLEKLSAGDVEFVEFLAPDGDVAYATLKATESGGKQQRIRIGEGFPIEQHDGWSSPAFAIKSVKKMGVPYKFTLPMLDNYK